MALFQDPFQNRQEPEVPKTSSTASSNIRKANSTTNIVDDLSAIFGGSLKLGVQFSYLIVNILV